MKSTSKVMCSVIVSATCAALYSVSPWAGVSIPPECTGDYGPPILCAPGRSCDGTKGNDLIVGAPGGQKINGGDGDDCIIGGPGNDVIQGGRGADVLLGGAGDDTLNGGWCNDYLDGGEGENDECYGGNGDDEINEDTCETFSYGREGGEPGWGKGPADKGC